MLTTQTTSEDPALKPVPAEILDQFVDDGPLTAQDIEAAMRRFKKALMERALRRRADAPSRVPARRAKPEEAPISAMARRRRPC